MTDFKIQFELKNGAENIWYDAIDNKHSWT